MNPNIPQPLKTKDEMWFVGVWRPAVGWTYILICIFDFICAPIMSVWYSIYTNSPLVSWESLTLSDGGMFHIAMGAILGASAWTRGQEKIHRINKWPELNNQYRDEPTRTPYNMGPSPSSNPIPPPYDVGN